MSRDVEIRPSQSSDTLRRIAMLVHYDGTIYSGFQVQNDQPTVQVAIERAIGQLTGEYRRVQGAGRTDAGVHASGQVIAFDTWTSYSTTVFLRATNRYLPQDIRVHRVSEVDIQFDPRRSAVRRSYSYHIINQEIDSPLMNRYTHVVKRPMNVTAMQAAATLIEGDIECAPFSGRLGHREGRSRRKISFCSVTRSGSAVTIDMAAGGFLPQQVRRTVGALVEIGIGTMGMEEFRAKMESGVQGAFRLVLPAKGLELTAVEYPVSPFESMDNLQSIGSYVKVGAI